MVCIVHFISKHHFFQIFSTPPNLAGNENIFVRNLFFRNRKKKMKYVNSRNLRNFVDVAPHKNQSVLFSFFFFAVSGISYFENNWFSRKCLECPIQNFVNIFDNFIFRTLSRRHFNSTIFKKYIH